VKRLATAILALALLPAASAQAQVEAIEPTFQLDRKQDVRGPLDIVRVAMSKRLDGSLRGELTMRRKWEDAALEGGSLCLRFYVKTDPESQAPEYLACATRPADGGPLAVVVGRPARTCGRDGLGQPPQDLREDHPGVAAGAQERAAREGRGDRVRLGGARFRGVDGRAHGQQQVGARVGVRDGEDVDAVQLRPVGRQPRERRPRPREDETGAGQGGHGGPG